MQSQMNLADPVMSDPLDAIRRARPSIRTAIRWACCFEAAAPKAGNVHPGQGFEDLNYADFVTKLRDLEVLSEVVLLND